MTAKREKLTSMIIDFGREASQITFAERTETLTRILDLACQPEPGVVHEVDREFHKLAIMERDYYKTLCQNRGIEAPGV
jgi:hypothetical protein